MTRYIFVADVYEGNYLLVTQDMQQADELLKQYNDPCNFDGMAQELIEPVAAALILHNVHQWQDYGGTVYELELA